MDNRTIINPEIQETPKTAINSEVFAQYEKRIESVSPGSELLDAGVVLCGKYTIERRLEVTSGEADLYLCEHSGGILFMLGIPEPMFYKGIISSS